MPQFKVAKTDNIDKLNNNSFTEDKLYIYKETNNIGKIFYNFGKDKTTGEDIRLRIGSSADIYITKLILKNDSETINISNIKKISDELSNVNINDVQLNSFVISDKSIYIITERLKNKLLLNKIYTQRDLKWNDYYEN